MEVAGGGGKRGPHEKHDTFLPNKKLPRSTEKCNQFHVDAVDVRATVASSTWILESSQEDWCTRGRSIVPRHTELL